MELCTLNDSYDYKAIIDELNYAAGNQVQRRLKEVMYFNSVNVIIVCLDVKRSNLFKHIDRHHLLDLDSFALLAVDKNGNCIDRHRLYSPTIKLRGLSNTCGINKEIEHLRPYLFRY